MKLVTWIDSRVEIMHILLLCLPNINFERYGNLKLPLLYNGKMRTLGLPSIRVSVCPIVRPSVRKIWILR